MLVSSASGGTSTGASRSRYDPLYWGAVFPLGMYTVATVRLSAALDMPTLMVIPRVSVYVALFAWAATAAGLVASLIPRSRR